MNRTKKPMKIGTQLFWAIGGAFALVAVIIVFLVDRQIRGEALRQAEIKATMILDRDLAVHRYFAEQLQPALFAQTETSASMDRFDPTWMSSTHAVREIDRLFQQLNPFDYSYRVCALSPRNPESECGPAEREFLDEIKADPMLSHRSGVRYVEGKPYFFILGRGLGMEPSSLKGHGDPAQAPSERLSRYASEQGFNHHPGEPVSAISILIPLDEAYSSTSTFSIRLSAVLIFSLFSLFIGVQWLNRRLISVPLAKLRDKAMQISANDEFLGEAMPLPPCRELQELTMAFNEMSSSLKERTTELRRVNACLQEDVAARGRAEQALRASEERYRQIVMTANEGIWALDADLCTTFVNRVMADMLRYEVSEMLGRRPSDFLFPEDVEGYELRREAFFEKLEERFEFRWRRRDGTELWTITSARAILDEEGRFAGVIGMLMDVTERRYAEKKLLEYRQNLERLVKDRTDELVASNQALQQQVVECKRIDEALQAAHQQLQDMIEFLPDATFVIDRHKQVIAWNRAIEEMTGVRKEDILGKGDYAYSIPFYGYPRPILIDLVMAETGELEQTYDVSERRGNTVFGEVYVPNTYGGKGAYLWGTASPLFDRHGNVIGAIESIRDITERKNARDALLNSQAQLRSLSSQLLRAQEEERKRIARDLHDTIGQSLAALKFNVENIQYSFARGERDAAAKALNLLIPKIQEVIEEARRIYMGLRPSILDDLGIIATIGWYCREYRKTYPSTHLEAQVSVAEEAIPEPLKIVIFRVIQESLNNIAKHSGAEYVTLTLQKDQGTLELIIEDNGLGFDLDAVEARGNGEKGLGIAGMRERTELSGGAFFITSITGQGTTVWASWPVDETA